MSSTTNQNYLIALFDNNSNDKPKANQRFYKAYHHHRLSHHIFNTSINQDSQKRHHHHPLHNQNSIQTIN